MNLPSQPSTPLTSLSFSICKRNLTSGCSGTHLALRVVPGTEAVGALAVTVARNTRLLRVRPHAERSVPARLTLLAVHSRRVPLQTTVYI